MNCRIVRYGIQQSKTRLFLVYCQQHLRESGVVMLINVLQRWLQTQTPKSVSSFQRGAFALKSFLNFFLHYKCKKSSWAKWSKVILSRSQRTPPSSQDTPRMPAPGCIWQPQRHGRHPPRGTPRSSGSAARSLPGLRIWAVPGPLLRVPAAPLPSPPSLLSKNKWPRSDPVCALLVSWVQALCPCALRRGSLWSLPAGLSSSWSFALRICLLRVSPGSEAWIAGNWPKQSLSLALVPREPKL